MELALIYDENILDSVFAAAAIASIQPCATYERKSFVNDYHRTYIWLGVMPTKKQFSSREISTVQEKVHVVISNYELSNSCPDLLRELHFNTELGESKDSLGFYGERTLLEKAMNYFNIPTTMFCGLDDGIRNFYKPLTSMEYIENIALNMREALRCLNNNEIFTFKGFDPETCEEASVYYQEILQEVRKAFTSRNIVSSFKNKDGETKNAYTFFEHKNWWLFKRVAYSRNIKARNVAVTATGTVVYGNFYVKGEFDTLNPVVLCY